MLEPKEINDCLQYYEFCIPDIKIHLKFVFEFTLGLLKCITVPSSFIILTSSMPGIWFTDIFLRADCNFLSSVAAVLCTTFFLRLAVPLPPVLTCACNFASFSAFIVNNSWNCAIYLHLTKF